MPKQARSISIYRKIAITFIVLTLLLAAVVVYFSIVSVKIVIIPNKERTSTSFIVTIKDGASREELKGLAITGLVRQVAVEAESNFFATGKEVKDVEVTGKITIYNTSRTEQPLIKTTRLLSSDGKLFRLKDTVRVPAGGQVDNVEVSADQAGQEMTIEPTKFTIPGLNTIRQESIHGESFEKFQYVEKGETLISNEDLNKAKENLKQRLKDRLAETVKNNNYQGYDNVVQKIDENAVKFETGAKAGDKVNEFKMSAKVDAAVVAFKTEDVSETAKLKVGESLPDDKQLESFDSNNFEYSVDKYSLDKGIADLKVNVAAQMILKEGTEIIKADRLVGLSRGQLDDYLSSLREVAGYEVKFTPNWITKVPSLIDHVKVEVVK
ncbi:hypothetical protein COT99_03860 [Candidatus Falkowbacteria bacterium CG10_big_fil_rev_8_21_14_0_10_43_10]|uniref:Baseplate protein J-like domain-containing protein n=1 Tax=Candidatus Falkowbacteria bacterium CG10_big_fil_rev_8_21_14_0_10_43_10 TaxID=1974567 RepID=A0A2H0V1D6_9BACT|nr:MAG: hypothetical protein COT99_03860 [Candidatus Falkowbacteria bacterium CG10_big_fil_rev_8_21_14_0_10_43_10]